MMKHTTLSILFSLLFVGIFLSQCGNSENTQGNESESTTYDIVIYGGTSAGIAAAIQAKRMGKTVILLEPEKRIGGLTTGGLGQTDIGNKAAIGGIAREFYQQIREYYAVSENWKWQTPEEYQDGGQTRTSKTEDAMWTFEPSAALAVYKKMLSEAAIEVVYNQRLNRSSGVTKDDQSISTITMESGETYSGRIFIDATYEGDLMATAGISYAIGRESNAEFGETLNGVQDNFETKTMTGLRSINGKSHNFKQGVDPYIEKGNPESGLLPYIDPEGPGKSGEGDKRIQAYCFRMCLTDHPDNRIPFHKPEGYDAQNYELLLRNFEAGLKRLPWINSAMPNRKTDTNNRTGFLQILSDRTMITLKLPMPNVKPSLPDT